MNPYTTSTVDTPAYKQLITGRTDDITIFLDHVVQGHSIALFGERRIGKSSLLFLIRDIITGNIESYRGNLVDLILKNTLDTLRAKVPSQSRAIHLNLQHVSKLEQKSLAEMIYMALRNQGFLSAQRIGGELLSGQSASQIAPTTILEVFQLLQMSAGNGRFVILFDEMECLQDFPDGEQIARNLRSIIESCPRICMIFAGAEGWYKQIKEKTSPLVHNVHTYYLKAPSRSHVETYLIKGLLCSSLSPSYDSSDMVRIIMGWTQSKAFYVQAVCETIVELYSGRSLVSNDWQEVVKERVFESRGPVLRDFYKGNNLDVLTKNILALLANKPGLTVKQVAERLGYSAKVIGEKMSDLVSLDKVRKRGAEYCIAGTLIEAWGKQNLEIPAMKLSWPQKARWGAALLLIVLAVGVYIYTHPELQTFSFETSGEVVTVQMPSSLEQGEAGSAIIAVQNTGTRKASTIRIFLSSTAINYQLGGTNQLTFDGLVVGEKRSSQPTYVVVGADTTPSGMLTSQIRMTQDNGTVTVTRTFSIGKRVLPLRQIWIPVSFLLPVLGAFINGKDLFQLIVGLVSFLQGKTQ